MVHRYAVISLLPALLGGCASSADPAGGEGYVLLDRGARGVLALEAEGWQGTPVLPIAVDANDAVTLTLEDGRSLKLAPEPGMLAHVHDVDGAIEWLKVGEDISADQLLLHGSERAAHDVALVLGGSISARDDGLWSLNVPDVFTRTSFIDPPEGLLNVLPGPAVGGEGALPPTLPMVATPEIARGSGVLGVGDLLGADAPEPGRREALVVGVYSSAESTLLLDASGHFSMEDLCSGELTREGYFYVTGNRVLLKPKAEAAVTLAIDKESLIQPASGERFRSLTPAWALIEQKKGDAP